VQERRKLARLIEALGCEVGPGLFLEEFIVPEYLQRLALGVVIGAGEAGNASLARSLWFNDFIDQPTPRPHLHQFAEGWRPGTV
jgi:hypothetical protein